MTKKDFIALADCLKAAKPGLNWVSNNMVQWELDCKAVAKVCKASNGAFKADRWFAYINDECGPNGGKK